MGLSPLPVAHTLQTVQIPQGGRRAMRLRALRGCSRTRAQMCAIGSLFLSCKTWPFLPNIPRASEEAWSRDKEEDELHDLRDWKAPSLHLFSLLLKHQPSYSNPNRPPIHPNLDFTGPWPLRSSSRPWHPSGRRVCSSWEVDELDIPVR